MAHVPGERPEPRLLLLDRQPEPRTALVAEADSETDAGTDTAQHRRVYAVVIAVTAVVAILLLLAGSAAGAFVFGLVAGSVSLVRYFHAIATRPDRHH